MHKTWVVAGVFPFCCGAAWGGDSSAPPDNLVHVREERQCTDIGNVFFRLAEQRRAGNNEATATRRVAEWAGQVEQTGSHYIKNNAAAVADAARLVFRLKQLNSISLGAFGRDSCRLGFAFENDDAKKTAAIYELVNAAVACQKQYPGELINDTLSECVRSAESAIAEKLKTAQVKIR